MSSMLDEVEVNGHLVQSSIFQSSLLIWGRSNFRRFPWRETNDPYRILTAEIMLHRTQAVQVGPIYRRFITKYPTIYSVHHATATELLEILYPLGLPQRVDLLTHMASDIVNRFGGQVPMERDDLESLPGVSDYITSAVRCFAWNLPDAIVDTNTVRIIGRIFGLNIKDSSRRNREFRRAIASLVDRAEPRLYSYALLDLAAIICTKRQVPACESCPLLRHCVYGQQVIEWKSGTHGS